jgi:hypothetical protein
VCNAKTLQASNVREMTDISTQCGQVTDIARSRTSLECSPYDW